MSTYLQKKTSGVEILRTFRRIFRRPLSWFSLLVVIFIVATALLSPVLAPHPPQEMDLDNMLTPPTIGHWLGTDTFGRDILSRLMWGSRASLSIAVTAVGMSLLIGASAGLIAAFYGGIIDAVIMRIMDSFLALPPILLALVLIGIMGPGMVSLMLALGFVYSPAMARVTRAKAMEVLAQDFVISARAIGAGDARILVHYLMLNAAGPIIVQATVSFAYAIIAAAGMSFLGLGVQPPQPSWGLMLKEARPFISSHSWFALIPGSALSISVLSLTLLGDVLREVLDPKGVR